MKQRHPDRTIAALLLLAYVPGLTQAVPSLPGPIALIAPAPHSSQEPAEDETPAPGL